MPRTDQGPNLNPVAAVLDNLRKAPRRVRRQSRDAINAAVRQLVDAAMQQPPNHGGRAEYRIDEVARRAGTTTRNVRAYRERGLLPPPRRVGRLALFDDSHVSRLTLIASMLERGYTISHVREMLTAWEEGKELADVIGVEKALIGTWSDDRRETVALEEVLQAVGDQHALDRLVTLGLIRVEGSRATVERPKLVKAFRKMRDYGMSMDTIIGVHEEVAPLIDQISRTLVNAGAQHVSAQLDSTGGKPNNSDINELVTMLVQFREVSVAAVTASLAASIETTIESVVGNHLTNFLHKASGQAAVTR